MPRKYVEMCQDLQHMRVFSFFAEFNYLIYRTQFKRSYDYFQGPRFRMNTSFDDGFYKQLVD